MQQEVQPPAAKTQPSEEEDARNQEIDDAKGAESGYEDRQSSVTGPATTTMGSD